jgi:sec-independent protein translocase protein TatA
MGTGLFAPTHLIILGVIALLLFGSKRLPEIGRSLGTGMREFKDSVSGVTAAKEVVDSMQEIHTAMSPANLAGAFVPGVREMQESVTAAKDLANPLGGALETGATAAGGESVTPSQS